MKRLCAGASFIVLGLAAAPWTHAGEPPPAGSAEAAQSPEDRAQRLADQAVDAYQAGRYDETVRLYKEAYGLRSEPTMLYNIARASEKGGKPAVALEYYRRYLVAEGTDPKLRQKAESRVAALATPKGAPALPGPQFLPPTRLVGVPPSRASGSPPLWRRPLFLAGVSLAGVGIVGLAVGAGLHGVAASDASSVTNNTNNDETQKIANATQAQHLAQGAVVGYAVGGAALVTGAVLTGLAVIRYRHEAPLRVSLGPTAAGAQLWLAGGF